MILVGYGCFPLSIMKRSLAVLLGLVALAIVFGLWAVGGYNSLVTGHQNVETAWAAVETQYQRRFDLIPNVINTVKGSAQFEQQTLTDVTAARTQWQNGTTLESRVEAAGKLDSAIGRLMVTVEAYPQLKSTEAFRDLITELEGTENRVAVARLDYNNSVRNYNLTVRRFPGMVLAAIFGFEAEPGFEASEGAENAPAVDFN